MPNRATSTNIPRRDILGSMMKAAPTATFIAGSIFSPFPVMAERGSYGVIPIAALKSRAQVRREPKSGYNRSDWTFQDTTYRCRVFGHEELRDDNEASVYGDFFDYETMLAMRGRDILLREQEIRARDAIHNTTTFPQSGNTGLAVTNEWDDASNAVPVDDIQAGREGIRAQCGLLPNVLQIAWTTWFDLWRCNQVVDRIKYTVTPEVPLPGNAAARGALAAFLGLDEILVADQWYNSAIEGQTETVSEVWTNEYAFLFYRNPQTRDLQGPTLGRMFHYDANGGLLDVLMWRDERVESDVYRVKQCVQEKVEFSACGFLFSNITT